MWTIQLGFTSYQLSRSVRPVPPSYQICPAPLLVLQSHKDKTCFHISQASRGRKKKKRPPETNVKPAILRSPSAPYPKPSHSQNTRFQPACYETSQEFVCGLPNRGLYRLDRLDESGWRCTEIAGPGRRIWEILSLMYTRNVAAM